MAYETTPELNDSGVHTTPESNSTPESSAQAYFEPGREPGLVTGTAASQSGS